MWLENWNELKSAILARFGPLACPSARPFISPALLVPAASRAPRKPRPAAARAVYSGPQLAACACRV